MKYKASVRNTLILGSIGIIITLLVGYVFRNTQNTYDRNMPYVKLGDYLKNSVTKHTYGLRRQWQAMVVSIIREM